MIIQQQIGVKQNRAIYQLGGLFMFIASAEGADVETSIPVFGHHYTMLRSAR